MEAIEDGAGAVIRMKTPELPDFCSVENICAPKKCDV